MSMEILATIIFCSIALMVVTAYFIGSILGYKEAMSDCKDMIKDSISDTLAKENKSKDVEALKSVITEAWTRTR